MRVLTAVILAAGAGRRLGELGHRYSKPMVPVSGRPLLAWVIDGLRRAGITRLVVVAHPSDATLAAFLRVNYPDSALVLQPERRGIADALQHALPRLAAEPGYLACACDSIFDSSDIAHVLAVGTQHAGDAVVAVLHMGAEATADRSAVLVDGDRVMQIVEKPPTGTTSSGLVAMPLYWLPRAMDTHLTSAPALGGERYVSTALAAFLEAGGTVRAVTIRRRLEITTAADVERAAARLNALPR